MSKKIKYPVFKPRLPTTDMLLPYLREIDKKRWYTNYGPLLSEFEKRLALHFGVTSNEVVTASNGTMALAQTLRAIEIPASSTCIVPSWTFAATPASVIWANLKPYFLDVRSDTWVLDFTRIKEISKIRKIGAVVVVSAFGAPISVELCDKFTLDTGIPVVIDAASGFDSFTTDKVGKGRTPIVISMHATKVSGIGEGAVVISQDEELIQKIRSFGNFGFYGSRESFLPGTNSKLSEYTAAVGLAMLDGWPNTKLEWINLTNKFLSNIVRSQYLSAAPGFGDGWISSYGLINLKNGYSAKRLSDNLTEFGIESRFWWGSGCNNHPAYRKFESDNLVITKSLAQSVLGLPFWLTLNDCEFEEIFMLIDNILSD